MNVHPEGGSLRRRAISGIVAALILFVMLFTVGTGYFLWISNNNASYSQALAQRGSAIQNQQQENLVLSATRGLNGHLEVLIKNVGGVSSNVTGLFVTYPSTLNPGPCTAQVGNVCGFGPDFLPLNTNPNLPMIISPQTSSPSIDTTVPVPAGTPAPAQTYVVKVVTQQGNTFSTNFSPDVTSILTTLLPSSVVTVGSAVNDSAELVGVTSNAGGTVQYEYFTSGTCSGTPNNVGTAITVSAGVVHDSIAVEFTTAGSYSWEATYSGDASNAAATSPCEPLIVQATPTVSTVLTPDIVAVGSPTTDTATVSGLTNGATGSVTYYYSNSDSCPDTGAASAGTFGVSAGTAASSNPVSFASAGIVYWYAVYSGDTYDTGAVSPCEPLAVGSFPTITTTLPATSIALGGSTTDAATLAGAASNPGGGATISFWWSFINACPTNGATEVSSQPVTAAENGQYISNPSRPFNTPGIYYWYATYSGDTYNAGKTSPCEPLTVGLAITTTLSASTITAGGSVSDFSTLHFATPNAGGSVSYQYFDSSDCSGAINPVNTVTVKNAGVPVSNAVTFSINGSYSWNAFYSGDANNIGPVTSPCEPLTVLPNTGGGGSGGSLGLVSESFRFYYTNCNPEGNTGNCPPGTGDGVSVGGYYGYGLSFNPLPTCSGFLGCLLGGTPTANPDIFQIQVTNTDPSRSITLSSQSFLLIQGTCTVSFLCSFLSTGFSQGYFIVDEPTGGVMGSGGNGGVALPYTSPVTISPGVKATLYFYCTGGPCTTSVPTGSEDAPPAGASLVVSVGLFGLYSDGTPFAQTIPYVASYVSPVYISSVSGQPPNSLRLTGPPGGTITLTANNFPSQPSSVSVYWTNTDGTTTLVTTGTASCSVGSPSTCTGVSFKIPTSAIPGQFYAIYVTSDGVNNAYATVGITGGSSTTVTCTPASVVVGGKSTCQATVTGTTPTGTITWSQSPSGIVTFATPTCTLVAGTCSVTVTGLANGPTTITGTYGGDINNQGSLGTFGFAVNQATPTIATTLSATTVPVGHPVTDSATLNGATSTAGGTVQYEYFTSSTCSGTATNDGGAVTVTNGIVPNSPSHAFGSAGSYGWEAVYSGDANNAGGSSSCEPLTVTTSTLTIAPTQGPAGTKTTLSGAGYAFTFTYNDCLSTSSASITCVVGSGSTFTSSGAGAIPAGTTVTVPSGTSAGSYFVIVYTGGAVVNSAPFTVTVATIMLSPTQGLAGKSVTVTGSGFSVNTPIGTFTFNGATPAQSCTSQMTSGTGAFSCTFTVPASSAGAKTVVASGNDVGTVSGDSASATFTVLVPTIVLSPTQGPKGITVTVTGSSFSPSTPISIFTFNGATPAQSCTSQMTSGTGTFSCTFTVPPDSAGAYTVVATGSDGGSDTASATFTITTPTITLTPSQGPVGSSVTVSGTGYSVNTAIGTITIAGGAIATQTCTSQTTSATGTFSCTFSVPSVSAGAHTVTVSGSDGGSDSATATFTATTPTLTLTPNTGPVGTTVTLSGTGYSPNTLYAFCFQSSGSACPSGTGTTFTSSGAGAIPGGVTIAVPGAGNSFVDVSQGATGGNFIISAGFTVTGPAKAIVWQTSNAACANPCSPNTETTNTGDLLVVTISYYDTATARTISSVSDGHNTYHLAILSTPAGSFNNRLVSAIYYSVATYTGSVTLTVTLSGTPSTAFSITFSEFTGSWGASPLTTTNPGSCTNGGTCSNSLATASTAYGTATLLIGASATHGGNSISSGSGFAGFTGACTTDVCGEWVIPASAGSTIFPSTSAGGDDWVDAGAVFTDPPSSPSSPAPTSVSGTQSAFALWPIPFAGTICLGAVLSLRSTSSTSNELVRRQKNTCKARGLK